MVQFDWLIVSYQRKEQWKCVWMQCGVACVTGGGITRMHLWFADNLDIQLQVRIMLEFRGLRSLLMNESSVCLKEKRNMMNLSAFSSFLIDHICLRMTQPCNSSSCSRSYIQWLLPCNSYNCSVDVLPFSHAYFGEHSSPGTNLTNLRCYGNESRLIDCTYSTTTSCSASYVAGVRCLGKTVAGIKLCSVIPYQFHMYIYRAECLLPSALARGW